MACLHFLAKKIALVLRSKPFQYTGKIYSAISCKQHSDGDKELHFINSKCGQNARHRHDAINQYPKKRIRIIHLQEGKDQKHHSKNKVEDSHELNDLEVDTINDDRDEAQLIPDNHFLL